MDYFVLDFSFIDSINSLSFLFISPPTPIIAISMQNNNNAIMINIIGVLVHVAIISFISFPLFVLFCYVTIIA